MTTAEKPASAAIERVREALAKLPDEALAKWVKVDDMPYIHATDKPDPKPWDSPVIGRFDYMQAADYVLSCNPASMRLILDRLAVLEAAPPVEQWMDISGAPLDGTPVIVGIEGLPGSVGEAYYWQNAEGRGGWQTWDGANHTRTVYTTPPTHYRPFPPPPSVGVAGVAKEQPK